ncbi:hypothetical protein FKP32DRAFT_1594606 [Trametes sanguinea]|nr:hypothetical protein FKP32DRAFT_1594606 [Trametes sanguinea]
MLTPDAKLSIESVLGTGIVDAILLEKDELTMTYVLSLVDGREHMLRLPCSQSSARIVECEVATARFISHHTSIPAPQVVVFKDSNATGSTDCFAIYDKPSAICLEPIFSHLAPRDQAQIVSTIARWMVDVFRLRFDKIGSICEDSGTVGPIASKPFFAEGRAKLPLNRGPFVSAREYFMACAQRELDACRMLFTQDAPLSYQRDLEESRLMVERIAGLFCDLTKRCHGLDEDDPDFAPFSLDMHDVPLKNIFVSPDDPTKIVAVTDWRFITTRPLWCCGRLPPWLSPSISAPHETARLVAIFKAEIARLDGLDSTFLRALELDDTRYTLDDLSTYDAFRDGFLLLPALENILATLPGHEDFAGLTALLDPSTLPGRVARINLLTHGSNAMYLAMTPPRSPLTLPVKDEGPEKAVPHNSSAVVT